MNSPRQLHAVWWHLTDLQLRWMQLNALLSDLGRPGRALPYPSPFAQNGLGVPPFPLRSPPIAIVPSEAIVLPFRPAAGTSDWLVAYV